MGPTASVLIGREPTEVDRVIGAELMMSVGEPGYGGEIGPDVLVATTRPVGGTYTGEGRPFWIEWQDSGYEGLPSSGAKIEEAFGLTPKATLLLSAGMKQATDHR